MNHPILKKIHPLESLAFWLHASCSSKKHQMLNHILTGIKTHVPQIILVVLTGMLIMLISSGLLAKGIDNVFYLLDQINHMFYTTIKAYRHGF